MATLIAVPNGVKISGWKRADIVAAGGLADCVFSVVIALKELKENSSHEGRKMPRLNAKDVREKFLLENRNSAKEIKRQGKTYHLFNLEDVLSDKGLLFSKITRNDLRTQSGSSNCYRNLFLFCVKQNIDAVNPLVFNIAKSRKGAYHCVLVYGYTTTAVAGSESVFLKDPVIRSLETMPWKKFMDEGTFGQRNMFIQNVYAITNV